MLLLMLQHNGKIYGRTTSNLQRNPSQNMLYMFLIKSFHAQHNQSENPIAQNNHTVVSLTLLCITCLWIL